jgi:hypothetical protein
VSGMALSLPERTYTRPDDDDDGDGEDDDGDGDDEDNGVADAMHKRVEGESSTYKRRLRSTVQERCSEPTGPGGTQRVAQGIAPSGMRCAVRRCPTSSPEQRRAYRRHWRRARPAGTVPCWMQTLSGSEKQGWRLV